MTNTGNTPNTARLVQLLVNGDIDNATETLMDLVGNHGLVITVDMVSTWMPMVADDGGRAQLMDVIVANSDLFPTPAAMDAISMRVLTLIGRDDLTGAIALITGIEDTDGAVITRTMAYAWLDACTDPIRRALILDTIRDSSNLIIH